LTTGCRTRWLPLGRSGVQLLLEGEVHPQLAVPAAARVVGEPGVDGRQAEHGECHPRSR
jgi:hypothetical protein